MTVKISKPAINLREELASLRNQGGLPKEDKLYLDNLVDNGDFSNGTTGWDTSDGNSSIVNGQLVINAVSGNKSVYKNLLLKPNTTYKVSIQLLTDGSYLYAYPQHGSNSNSISGFPLKNTTSTGSVVNHSTVLTTTGTGELRLRLYGGGGSTGTIDNISVQEVGENLVTNGTFDYDSGWTPSSAGAASGISNGQAYLESSGGNARLSQNVNLEAGKTYTIQFDLISQAGFGLSYVRLGTSELLPINSVSIGKNSGTFVANSANNLYFGTFANNGTSFTIDNVILTEGNHQVIQSIPHGYDVKDVYIDGELAREGEAYDYEVKTDGINQWLKPSVEPTATTETVVIGVRK